MHTLEHRVVIIYDSTDNSVFESQLLQPLLQWRSAQPNRTVTIISCEQNPHHRPEYLAGIKCIYLQRMPYLGRVTLWPAIIRIGRFLRTLPAYHLFARGPFAGYIAKKAATQRCNYILVQARGLAAQEYRFAQEQQSRHTSYISKLRIHLLQALERSVYAQVQHNLIIEAVSPAMRDYLITHFHASAACVTIATEDIPEQLDASARATYRTAIRTQLQLPPTITLYCYNGSGKPWQCPEETVLFFKAMLTTNPTAHLLILTQDIEQFRYMCIQNTLPDDSYTIRSVASSQIMAHLAACDIGILFRKPDVINYTARPTKALEYYAAGCTIVHNNTVHALQLLPKGSHIYNPLPER
jgi:hypothetical protein